LRARPLETTISALPRGSRCVVLRVVRPGGMDPESWKIALSHLEELGLLAGEEVRNIGSLFPGGPFILRCMGSKVAISGEVAGLIVVRPLAKC
jgi:Fe2+ transport system protein FeoA